MFFTFSVMLFLLLASCTSSNVPTTEKTVPQGATVTEPVLNVSSLDKDDQLMTYHQDKLCAEYFCDNGTCNNHPTSESYFQVYSGNLCLIIPNVNSSNNGQYSVILNGNKDVLKLTLHVEGQYVTVICMTDLISATDLSHICTCRMLVLVESFIFTMGDD